MQYRMLALDVDGTIAGIGKGVERDIADFLIRLEEKGFRIVFNSGKNAAYLAGLARGIGI